MISLATLTLEDGYRTNDADLLNGFYLPCLSKSVRYDRSVGYFDSGALALALRGVGQLLKNNGRIRIIASPQLSRDDLQAIEDGYEARARIEASVVRSTESLVKELPANQQRLLKWLIENNLLNIRLAVLTGPIPAIYHEKRGLFVDSSGNCVTFLGSANETAAGLRRNFESVEVFRSWVASENRRTVRHVADFERLWNRAEEGVTILDFPEAAKHVILRTADVGDIDLQAFDKTTFAVVSLLRSGERELYDYQRDAIRAWLNHQCKGILQMPTGSGKTMTALSALRMLMKSRSAQEPLLLIIVVPLADLVRQWAEESGRFSIVPLLCYKSIENWDAPVRTQIAALNAGVRASLVLITTNSTFVSSGFQKAIEMSRCDATLVVDEVHNIGSAAGLARLTDRYRYRLGLSATPERWFDDEGTQRLVDYFGGIVFTMTLKEAIERGALTPYRYFVHPVRLSEDETVSFMNLSDQISKLSRFAKDAKRDSGPNDQLKMLLIKRARIVATAEAKPQLLQSLVAKDVPQSHTLVYCGVGTSIDADGTRVVDQITRELNHNGLRSASYTSRTPQESRHVLQEQFAAGSIQYLVAMRCLDEGIDIPATQRAYFLASSTNPRQFIQRRGRVLRRFPGKERSEIHDMLTLLHDQVTGVDGYQKSILGREIQRIRKFAEIAENGDAAMASLLELVPDRSVVFADSGDEHGI